jgi:hypothetical protein
VAFRPEPDPPRSFNHVVEPLSPQEYAMLFGGRGKGRRVRIPDEVVEGDER